MQTTMRHIALAPALILSISGIGCATARLTQFNTFAQAGITYVTATQAVIQAAGAASVDEDTALLVRARASENPERRKARLTTSNALLRERLQVLSLINEHGTLLQSYFEALAALSDPKAADSVGAAAQSIYNSLSAVSTNLKNAKIGGTSVASFIPQVTAPIVAVYKVKALQKELGLRSKAIAEELALQNAAFSAIEAELKVDTQVQQNLLEDDNINQFANATTLPSTWGIQRAALLSPPVSIAAIDAASKAAAQLQNAFAALVENRLDSLSFSSLISQMSNLISASKTTTQ